MSELPQLTEIESLLLMAAEVQGIGPNTPLQFGNTAKVLLQVLDWCNVWDDEVSHCWNNDEEHPSIERLYDPLVRMIPSGPMRGPIVLRRPGEQLFEGRGNWETPCRPRFNSCRLTAYGQTVAQELLSRNPQYRDKVRK